MPAKKNPFALCVEQRHQLELLTRSNKRSQPELKRAGTRLFANTNQDQGAPNDPDRPVDGGQRRATDTLTGPDRLGVTFLVGRSIAFLLAGVMMCRAGLELDNRARTTRHHSGR